jgi:phosphoadenosine phosphosulfate reductase
MATIVTALRESSPGVLTFDGVRSSESPRRSTYERISIKHKIKGEVVARPIQKWLSIHVWLYILVHGLDFNYGYRYGFRRIGCLPCPFNSRWSNYLTAIYYYDQDKKWRRFLYEHAKRVGHPNPKHFSEEGWESRAGGRGQHNEVTKLSKEICLVQGNAYTYKLLNLSDSILEYIKPFGKLNILQDDGIILKGTIVSKNKLIANIKMVRPQKTMRIEFQSLGSRKMQLLVGRFERQLKKYQTCILCGSCNMNCIMSAINANGKYIIDECKCTHCLQCVRSKCIALDSLSVSDTKTTWETCNGSN